MTTKFLGILALTMTAALAMGCAAETAPEQDDGMATAVISGERVDEINAELALNRCPRRCEVRPIGNNQYELD